MTYPVMQTFSPSLLSDYEGLKRYLYGEEDLATIRAHAKQAQFEESSSWGTRSICKMCLNHALGSSLILIFPLTLLLNTIGLRHIHSFCDVAFSHLTKEFGEYFNSYWFRDPILVPATNKARMDASDVYMCPDIPADQITDPRVLMRTQPQYLGKFVDQFQYVFYRAALSTSFRKGKYLQIPGLFVKAAISFVCFAIWEMQEGLGWAARPDQRNFRQIVGQLKKDYPCALESQAIAEIYKRIDNFHAEFSLSNPNRIYKGDGVCRGAAEYFIHLCIESRKWFDDSEKWLTTVANQFRDGVPGQGVLMQTLFDISSCVFGYSVTEMREQRVSTDELNARSETAIQKIEAPPPGIYSTGVHIHELVYIKLENGISYTWNSECGLLRHTAEQLLDHVIRHYHKQGQQDSSIVFKRYRLFRWFPFISSNRDGL